MFAAGLVTPEKNIPPMFLVPFHIFLSITPLALLFWLDTLRFSFVLPPFVYPDLVRQLGLALPARTRLACSSLVHLLRRRIFSLRHRRCFGPYSLLTTTTHDRSCDMGIQENFFRRREKTGSPRYLYIYCPPSANRVDSSPQHIRFSCLHT